LRLGKTNVQRRGTLSRKLEKNETTEAFGRARRGLKVMINSVEITVFRKQHGVLSKRISLNKEGNVKSDGSECRMAEGSARRVKLESVDALADLIEQMPSYEALALGQLRTELPENVKVILARDLNGKIPADVIARTAEYLRFEPGASAYMLLDYDLKGQPREVADKLKELGGFWKAIIKVVPELAKAARVTRKSTSAGLYHRKTNEWLGSTAGRHVYIAVKDGNDIKRALETLHDRLWLSGLGYHVVGACGQLLDRSIIDAGVFGPERLVFEGAPILVPPVAQDKQKRQPQAHDGEIIDTSVAIPPLSDDERTRLTQLKAVARERLRPEAAAARKNWAKKFATRRSLSEEEAEKIATDAVNYILQPDFELEFDELGQCTVREMLADPENYVGQILADPLEGVAYGRGKAKVFRQADARVMINSFAHGGIRYQLAGQGVTRDDFFACMERHNYLFAPTRQPWPAGSVNARIPPVPLFDAAGEPILDERGKQKFLPASVWLDQHRPVEQINWAPGMPMLIENRLIDEGGWIVRNAVGCFNLYRPPEVGKDDGGDVAVWIDHVNKLYPDDAEHIILWLAHRVQRPEEKINHALVLGGAQGIGKDTLLEPVKYAVGPWNFKEVSPQQVMGRFNGFLKSVILRVNEARDLGDFDRYALYDHMKAYTAAPPDVLRVDEKNLREHSILNCCGVIITTNHKTDGIYLPSDDRRHYVAWSELTKEDFEGAYFRKIWQWYRQGGMARVAGYLNELDLKGFDAKAPPPKTAGFFAIVDAGVAPEDAEFADAIDALAAEGKEEDGINDPPGAVTLDDMKRVAGSEDFSDWLDERKNRRTIVYRMEACGYVQVRNTGRKDGRWKIAGRRVTIYAKSSLTSRERHAAAEKRVKKGGRRGA
jgi:Family of unknown function (DUF5906)